MRFMNAFSAPRACASAGDDSEHDYPAPLDDIKQEYAQADRLANPWNTFQGTRPDKSLKSS
jgi:hypothetical protein